MQHDFRRWIALVEAAPEPSLRAAIRFNGTVYVGASGEMHLDVLQNKVPIADRSAATFDAETRGFVTERGRYLDRRQAQRYAVKYHLYRDNAPDWVYTAPELITEWLQAWLDRWIAR